MKTSKTCETCGTKSMLTPGVGGRCPSCKSELYIVVRKGGVMPQVWDVEVGRVVEFTYHGKPRFVKVESLEKGGSVMKGWDYNADHPTGGWRSFLRDEVVGTPYEVIQVR